MRVRDLTRDVLGVYNLPSESAEGWREVIQDFKQRGVRRCLMIIADGIAGLEAVVQEELPTTKLQKCIVHKKRNVLAHVRNSDKPFVAADLADVFVVDDKHYTPQDGHHALERFLTKWGTKYPNLRAKFRDADRAYYFSYLYFPYRIQRMIYTTNWIERLIKTVRKTQRSRNAFPNPSSALNLIGACVMEVERTTYSYRVPAFLPAKDFLDAQLEAAFPQTHNN
ncbi:MAG: transposase [Spirochaetales bacterium]|nr:transposase [Spirochaetales bacterium]